MTEKIYFHTRQIINYVKSELGVNYTVAGINKWLHHHGFSYKQTKDVPHKLKPEEQQAFIENYNEELKSNDAPVLFMDAVHPIQSTQLCYVWIRKEQDKLIETTGNRTRVNLTGVLPLKAIGATITETYETLDSESIVRFFSKSKKEHYPLEKPCILCLMAWSIIGQKFGKTAQYKASLLTSIQSKLKSNRAALESHE